MFKHLFHLMGEVYQSCSCTTCWFKGVLVL